MVVCVEINFKGVLPVGGAQAFPMGREGDEYLFEVTHADFEHSLYLKSNDKTDVDDWIQVLQECRKATFSNGLLGSALLDRLKSVGTTMEKEKQLALEELQRQAVELDQAREEKWKTMMEHMEAESKYNAAVNSQWGQQQRLQEQMDEVARKVEESRLAKLTEEQLAEEAKAQLAAAKEQLVLLRSAVEARRHEINTDPDVAAEVDRAMATITKFFESNA